MPSPSLHEQYIAAYVLYIIIQAIFQPPQTLEDLARVELSILSLPFPTLTGSFSICAPSILM